MQGKTHSAIGTAVAMAALKPSIGVVLMAVTGSLAVDMDVKSSKASQMSGNIAKVLFLVIILMAAADKLFNTSFVASTAEKFVNIGIGAVLLAVWFIMKSASSHRGFTHSLAGMAIISFAAFSVVDAKYAAAFFIGYLCHIIADLFNKKGCQLFFPNKKRFCFELCRSSGIINSALFFAFSAISILEIAVFVIKRVIL